MIYYLKFNAANLPGIIQVNDTEKKFAYLLVKTAPTWQQNYQLRTANQTVVGGIYQTSAHLWPNYSLVLGDHCVAKIIHLNVSRHQLMLVPTFHWIIHGNLIENNYFIQGPHRKIMMTVDNIYYPDGHEGYLLRIAASVEPPLGILIAAILNQTSRKNKTQRSYRRFLNRRWSVN
ncbi:hypothetical protein HU830_08085 [Lactobacillus sp. DCY120]|uniref:Uncharacterized protein n=1 Tax=Bombilactobacillus apium TaxID=2675299 RepID=A0A850RED8_9LACO|nr:hypothetical protein [Bombilactobacillus apium]NVY97078.1 hypothetical protein [Bombilactobacillus apium]